MRIFIQGYGAVGSTIHKGLVELGYSEFLICDPEKGLAVNIEDFEIFNPDVMFYCVNELDGAISDYSYIMLMYNRLTIIKSTLTVGETDYLEKVFNPENYHLVYMPEFLRENHALHDFLNPDLLVFGSNNLEASTAANAIFSGIKAPRLFVKPMEAELLKLVSNSFPLTKLVFFNQIYEVCRELDLDYDNVINIFKVRGDDSFTRIFDKGGRGGGGKCLPKDLDILIQVIDSNFLKGIKNMNDQLLRLYPKDKGNGK